MKYPPFTDEAIEAKRRAIRSSTRWQILDLQAEYEDFRPGAPSMERHYDYDEKTAKCVFCFKYHGPRNFQVI